MTSDFETQLLEHESLHKLIKEHDINTFAKLPSKDTFSEAFIDWISPKYYDAFVSIYNTHLGQKSESKVVKVINSPWICNTETKERLVAMLIPRLEAAEQLSKELQQSIDGNKDLEVIIQVSGSLANSVLNYPNKAIFEVEHPNIISKKNNIIDHALSICEELKQYKASSSVEFTFFNGLLDKMKSIHFNEEQQQRYDACLSKSKSSSNKYIAITVVIAIIALIRLIAAIA
ncbi:MAG: hypothetical protein GYB32_00525 [Algicola sp.]|nr:hypothetical protein [Algicola sp.]